MREDPAVDERALRRLMNALRVHQFGALNAIIYDEASRRVPGEKQVLVQVKAAEVGLREAWARAAKSALPQPLPLVLGSDISGVVEDVGRGVSDFQPEVFGITNPNSPAPMPSMPARILS